MAAIIPSVVILRYKREAVSLMAPALADPDVLRHTHLSVPEPSALLLAATGLLSLLALAWRRRV